MHEVVFYVRFTTGTTVSDKAEAERACQEMLVEQLKEARCYDDNGLFSAEIIGAHVERL